MSEITDTQRLDFIEKHYGEIRYMREPHCKCGCCKSYFVVINTGDKEPRAYPIYDIRGISNYRVAIDEAMKTELGDATCKNA